MEALDREKQETRGPCRSVVPGPAPRPFCEAGCGLSAGCVPSLTVNLLFSPMFSVGKSAPECSGLPKGCLLYKTLQVQMLDLLDIEGLYPLYRRVERYLEEFPEER